MPAEHKQYSCVSPDSREGKRRWVSLRLHAYGCVTNKQLSLARLNALRWNSRSGGRCVIIFTLLPFMSVVSSFVCARATAVLTDRQTCCVHVFCCKLNEWSVQMREHTCSRTHAALQPRSFYANWNLIINKRWTPSAVCPLSFSTDGNCF
jgi:hypothetical protein